MYTYEETKSKGVHTIQRAMGGLVVSNDHNANKELLGSIIEAAKLLLWLEDLQAANEKGDLIGMMNAQRHYKG